MTIPESRALAGAIPRVAWRRGIGVPPERVGRPRVDEPMVDDGPWSGVPIGGLGAGSIGRTYRGDFRRWHLTVGEHRVEDVPLTGFSVFVGRPGRSGEAHVLSTLRPQAPGAWAFDMPVGGGTYHALFPRAWFEYEWPGLPVRLVEEQLSPVIAGDYDSSALPVGVFSWTIENPTADELTVGLMFSWLDQLGRETGVGAPGTHAVRDGGEVRGFEMRAPAATGGMAASLAVVAATSEMVGVSARGGVPLASADALWRDFAADGALDRDSDDGSADGGDGTQWGRAVLAATAATVTVPAGGKAEVRFALAWDLPFAIFGGSSRLPRRHTRRFGSAGDNAFEIASLGIREADTWRTAIERWQAPILEDAARPDWYKAALFNELYYLLDGGTIWADDGPEGGAGRFALLECVDYPFYNTLDVDFYASWALVRLWPELEIGIVRAFAETVSEADPEVVEIEATGERAVRKVAGALPHDLGGPDEDPFGRSNRYHFQDPNLWKDLNPKFVLRLWRDHVLTGDDALVPATWPAVTAALEFVAAMDRDGDGLPEHDATPDQTYDTWPMHGPSAYGGSLWIAALAAAVRMAAVVGDLRAGSRFGEMFARARATYESALWRDDRYAFDDRSDSVMADQLVGQWYADATGLGDLVDPSRVAAALRTIHRLNVRGFGGGTMGPVNGMCPDGSVDTSSEQSQEVWVGTAYALAAFMIGRGLVDEGWQTARGVAAVTYERGLWFRTPEAYDEEGNFRASLYLRPLAIWAIEEALERR